MRSPVIISDLIDLLRRPSGATNTELLAVLANSPKGGSSKKTLERILKELREDYHFEINHNKATGRYTLEDSIELRKYSNQVISMHFRDFYLGLSKIPESIDFGIIPSEKSVTYIEEVSQALTNKEELRITHQSFNRTYEKIYLIKPVMLRSWSNRWYLVAINSDTNRIGNYGMDRIKGLRKTGKTFTDDLEPIKSMYQNIIGITDAEKDPKEVRIKINDHGGNFINSLKIHHSQKMRPVDEEVFKYEVRWNLVINYEFLEFLASFHQPFSIVEPEELKVKFHNHLQNLARSIQD